MGKFRGYNIRWDGSQYVFCDTGEPTIGNWKKRPCGHCGLHNTPQGHDGCLGALWGVINACCGHGVVNEAYLQYPDYSCIRGKAALNQAKELHKTTLKLWQIIKTLQSRRM